jgi:uncharacterized protein (TIRG00374 family)
MTMRRFLIFLGLIGLGLLIAANLGGLPQFITYLHKIHWYLIPLLILMQFLSYYCNAHLYKTFFSISGHAVPMRKLIEISLGINFASQVIPASGIAGTAYLTNSLKGYVPPGKVTLAQIGRYIFAVGTTIPLLLVGIMLIFFSGSISHISVRLVLFILVLIITAGVGGIVYLSDRAHMRQLIRPIIKSYNRFGTYFLRSSFKSLTAVEVGDFLDEFYAGYNDVIRNKRTLNNLTIWGTGGNIAEMATIYAVFIGFGAFPNPGIVILAYQIAIAASLIGPLTAGAGALEFGMVGAFTALGQPFGLSLAVVIVYRVISMAIFLPPGFYYYRRGLK